MDRSHWISVLPKNYRSIALYAIENAVNPTVLVNRRHEENYSESGPLTQCGISAMRDFEIRDGSTPILGFHDHPREMWITKQYEALAQHCEDQGWLKIQNDVRGSKESRLRKLLVHRFVDLRFTLGGLTIAAAIAFVVTKVVPSFSFGPTFAATIVAWLFVGLSTLADE